MGDGLYRSKDPTNQQYQSTEGTNSTAAAVPQVCVWTDYRAYTMLFVYIDNIGEPGPAYH